MRLKPRTKAPRKEQLIDLDEFRAFVSEKVTGVRLFQFGCVMEPTLDKRLCDFMAAVAASPAAPSHEFRLQTNGILLHRHDVARMLAAGLTLLTISVTVSRATPTNPCEAASAFPRFSATSSLSERRAQG